MCFNQSMSFGFAALGLAVAIFVYSRSENLKLTIGILFFFLMEFLQGLQYFWIDQCNHPINRALTVAGFIHICMSILASELTSSMTRNERVLDQYKIVLRMSLLAGFALFSRYLLADYTIHPVTDSCPTNDWLRGTDVCTYRGNVHLAWSIPMKEPSYFVPSSFIHCFMMIAPFLVMGQKYMWVQGIRDKLIKPAAIKAKITEKKRK
ncbi:hypothetical protein HDU91_004176 [Kappamyces sp. JEL0680]|nr:hypothetical protein HDU91_004176 [Kappamyces sp. JEL0680]